MAIRHFGKFIKLAIHLDFCHSLVRIQMTVQIGLRLFILRSRVFQPVHFPLFGPLTFNNLDPPLLARLRVYQQTLVHTRLIFISLLGKSWETHPEFFRNFSFPGLTQMDFWKTHPSIFCKYLFSFCKISGHELDLFLENMSIFG